MTYSLLARDPKTGALGGAAATGNLCVGAWVLRGRAGTGVSASQGHYPSTVWGEAVLDHIERGSPASDAVKATIAPDPDRDARQLLALDQRGQSGSFSGATNVPCVADLILPDICAGGNMLSTPDVVTAVVDGYVSAQGSFARRLLAGLVAGTNDGGDMRGLMSAAILIVAPDRPPLDLRVDYHAQPLHGLTDLIARTEDQDYADWIAALPTQTSPSRTS